MAAQRVYDLDPPPAFTPRPVGRGSWGGPAALVVLLGAAIAVGALFTRGDAELPLATATQDPAALPPVIASPGISRTIPASVACHELDRSRCLAIVEAAMAELPGDAPTVATASAWAVLLCDSSIDCPPDRLRAATPLGSVVIAFGDGGPDAWLNVIEVPAAESGTPGTDAWIVRWDRRPAASPGPKGAPPVPEAAPGP